MNMQITVKLIKFNSEHIYKKGLIYQHKWGRILIPISRLDLDWTRQDIDLFIWICLLGARGHIHNTFFFVAYDWAQ
jgi:hypothetical protein